LAIPLSLSPSLAQRAHPFRESLEELGFAFASKDGTSFLEAIPALPDLSGTSPEDLLRNTVDSLECPEEQERFWSVWRRWATLACKAAVKLTTQLEPSEAEALLDDLLRCGRPWACPHGRPTSLAVSAEQLFRHFGRE
jgi:DNA mismatch repair protein MutL